MSSRITGLSSMATRHILADLAREYELRSGIGIEIRSMGGVEAAKLLRAGEPTDVVVLASKVMESLGGRRPCRQRQHKGFRAIGDRHCGRRRLAATQRRKRTGRQAGHAWGEKNLLLDRVRAATT